MIKIYIDGGFDWKNRHGACGMVIESDGKVVKWEGRDLGVGGSNNVSEYLGLELVLDRCKEKRLNWLYIYSDSLLLVNQFNGRWAIKNDRLRYLMSRIKEKVKNYKSVRLFYIPREKNISDCVVRNILYGDTIKFNKSSQKLDKSIINYFKEIKERFKYCVEA